MKIDMTGSVSYTVGHAVEDMAPPAAASDDMGAHGGSATGRREPALRAAKSSARRRGVRCVSVSAMRLVLRGPDRLAESGYGPVFPVAAGLLRRTGFQAGERVARSRLAKHPNVSGRFAPRVRRGLNLEWTHPYDSDVKITKMKDGRTHLAHTVEHTVDLETVAIVGITVKDASAGNTTILVDLLVKVAEQVVAVGITGIADVVADKRSRCNKAIVWRLAIGVCSYVSEPDCGRRHCMGHVPSRDAVSANRRRIRGVRGTPLLRQQAEPPKRPNAHLYETGGVRRVYLRRQPNILERLIVKVGNYDLRLLMRYPTGVGTPPSFQGHITAGSTALNGLLGGCRGRVRRLYAPNRNDPPDSSWRIPATCYSGP